ncbi:unnamed protein product, partial [Candidula unifasciata]
PPFSRAASAAWPRENVWSLRVSPPAKGWRQPLCAGSGARSAREATGDLCPGRNPGKS